MESVHANISTWSIIEHVGDDCIEHIRGEKMTVARVATAEGLIAILLPPEVAERLGLQIGDSVDISIDDRSLVVTPSLSPEERAERIRISTQRLLREREEVYKALAQGEED
jgi:antitoxin component of MazEF toxin-antitoxin module